MSLDLEADQQPVTSADELLAYFQSAERPEEEHRVGLEHEKLVVPSDGFTAAPYEGPRGIGALLERLAAAGYQRFREGPEAPVIALTKGAMTISLEPGGQLELSGSPTRSAREAHQENLAHLSELKKAASPLGLRFLGLGYRPFDQLDAMPWMPKTRYRVMRQTLGARGELALNMMLMTATAQVSLDWESEADCVRKVVAAARITPLLVALFANSPLADGKPAGFLSFRSHIWTQVDAARCGYLPAMFDGTFGYRAYVEWALDAPLLFLRRNGNYLTPKLTFRQLLRDGFDGRPALKSDWVDHLSTMFPEVRIKRVMELRSADCNSMELTGSLLALSRGIFYDASALASVDSLIPPLSFEEHLAFHEEAQRRGLQGKLGGRLLADYARDLLRIARGGLERVDAEDVSLLQPLEQVAAEGRSPAARMLETFQRGVGRAELLTELELREG